jgi:MFS family permease
MAVLSAVLMFALAFPAGMLLRHRPEPYGWTPDGDATPVRREPGTAAARSEEAQFTPRQALLTSSFWLIGIGHSLSLLVTGAVMVHFAAHVRDGLGYSLGTAAAMVTLMTALQVAGQLAGGYLGDRLDKRLLIAVAIVMTSVGLLVLAAATALWMVAVFAALNGIGFGARIPLTTAIRADYFGSRHYGTISGFNGMIVTVGIMAGPVIAGLSYDATGSYEVGFTWLALVGALGAVMFAFVRKPATPA